MNVHELVAKAKADLVTVEPEELDIEVGGGLVHLEFFPTTDLVWADLVAVNPPRAGSKNDNDFGFNPDAVGRDYPVELIKADGEPVTAELWADIYSVIASPNVKNIGLAVWGLNQYKPALLLVTLGKASAGAPKKKRSSPAK